MKQKFGSRIINKNRLLSQEVCHVANQNYFYKPNINDLFTNILITNLIFFSTVNILMKKSLYFYRRCHVLIESDGDTVVSFNTAKIKNTPACCKHWCVKIGLKISFEIVNKL